MMAVPVVPAATDGLPVTPLMPPLITIGATVFKFRVTAVDVLVVVVPSWRRSLTVATPSPLLDARISSTLEAAELRHRLTLTG